MSEKRYRDLDEGDTLQVGDEFLANKTWKLWYSVPEWALGITVSSASPKGVYRRPIAEPIEIVVRCFEGCGSTEEYANPADHGWLYIGPKCDDLEYNWICPECAKAQGEPTEEPMQELTTCHHGALHTVKCGKCENGGEVGTPRCDAEGFEVWTKEYGNVEVVPLEFARQLERETVDLQGRLEGLANAACATCEERDNAKKERDEWRELATSLAWKLRRSQEGWITDKDIDAALAAYELKAQEGV